MTTPADLLATLTGNAAPAATAAAAPAFDMNAYLAALSPEQRAQLQAAMQPQPVAAPVPVAVVAPAPLPVAVPQTTIAIEPPTTTGDTAGLAAAVESAADKPKRGRPAKAPSITVEIPGELAERLIAILERVVQS